MNRGYVKLWRKSLDKGWLSNHKLWAFWCYCLMKASHKDITVFIENQTIHLKSGQFIFGRKKAALDLKIHESSIYRLIEVLVRNGNIETKSNNKFTIITIVNWDSYQDDKIISNSQRTTSEQRANTYKNVKECKEKPLPGFINKKTFKDFQDHRKQIKKPMTTKAVKLLIGKLTKYQNEGFNPNEILETSILNGWAGVFKPNGKKEEPERKFIDLTDYSRKADPNDKWKSTPN